ncbi:hypothetical protein [Mucilaginibacter sp.]|uniref:hypothetical protein n=1 Tax=Mucilaginibacter sp. TaxID=1882438 RepID=UPI0035BBF938
MYIAYSALRETNTKQATTTLQQRLKGYQAACQKYQQEIADIQKYLPGWTPEFKLKA